MPYIVVKYSTLLLKLNFLFQILIRQVNNVDLKQYFFLAQYAFMYLCNMDMLTCIYASYLQKLVAVSSIQDEIITHLAQLKAILKKRSHAL